MASYQTISPSPEDADEVQLYVEQPNTERRNRTILGALLVGLVIAIMAFAGEGGQQQPAAAALLGSAKKEVTACTFAECYATGCNHKKSPYTCLFHNGGPHGGCSAIPWVEGSCTTQCDLSGCDDLDVPEHTPSCKGVECTKQWCKEGQLCTDPKNPYQCTMGSARFGCASDAREWTLRTDSNMCGSCCDASTCE